MAPLNDEEYTKIESAAYEAAVVSELWPALLERVGVFTESAGAAIGCFSERGGKIVQAPRLDRVFARFAEENWAERNGRASRVISRGLVGNPGFSTDDDYLEPGEADSDPMIRDLFRAEGFGWAAGFMVQLPHGDMLIMNVEQYYERGPIRGEALERLNSLYSVFARAATLAARVDFERTRTAIEMLGAVGLPAAALSTNSQVILANPAFVTASHVWTTRGGDRLALHDRVADRMLMDALTATGPRNSRSVPVRTEGEVTAVVQVVPVRRSALDIFARTNSIVILSETATRTTDSTLIHSLFDLTAAEITVAQAIASGRSPNQIAASNGRSVSTIRNQIRSIMSKTGCRRLVDVALLIRQLGR